MDSPNLDQGSGGCQAEFSWLAAGFVLSCASPTFYRQAARRRVVPALLFFIAFTTLVSLLFTLKATIAVSRAGQELVHLFVVGEIPSIKIQDGIAQASEPQPFVIQDSGAFYAIDTTGEITRIDTTLYTSGILLTDTSLHLFDEDGYNEWPIKDLMAELEMDSLVIDAQSVGRIMSWFIWAAATGILIGLLLWFLAARLAFLAFLSVIIWGLISIFRAKAAFGPVFISGLYALVPAAYLTFLIDQAGGGFFGMQTLIWLLCWAGVGVLVALRAESSWLTAERPARLWRFLIGLPMLAAFALQIVFAWSWGSQLVWGLAIATGVALLLVAWFTRHSHESQPTNPFTPPTDFAIHS